MKLLPLSKNGTTTTTRPTTLMRSSSWPWQAYCHQPKTLSFRGGDDLFRSINSAYLESPEEEGEEEGYEEGSNDECIETVIRGARSECRGRLFFEPAGETSSVLAVDSEEDGASGEQHAREELGDDGVAVCVVESRNPFRDFRTSMEEMVEAHALRGSWDSLEDLLRCYLRVNDRANHAYIFGAFVDLLLSSDCRRTRPFTGGSSCSCNRNNNGSGNGSGNSISPLSTSSPCSPLSFYPSSSSCCSSSNSLSTTPCCISTTGEAEDSSSSSSSVTVTVEQRQQCLPLSLKAAMEQDRPEGDEASSSASSSSSDV